jgi:branched-chain amino acid transport system substrate-binding protein
MSKVRHFAAALVIVLAGAGAMACSGNGDEYVIGVAGPIQKPNGRSLKMAAEMAVKEINDAGGIDGRKIRLQIEDDGGDASRAIESAARLRANPAVLAVIGHVNSGATLNAAPVYNGDFDESDAAGADSAGRTERAELKGTHPLVEISPASSGIDITNAGEWTFRSVPTDLEHGPVVAHAVGETMGRQRAAILYTNDDYGRGVMTSFGDAFRRLGRQVVTRDPYVPAMIASSDGLSAYLARAIRNGADAIVIAGQVDGATRIIGQARAMGFKGPILGGDGLTSLKDSASGDGLFISSAWLPDRADPAAQEFVRKYYETYHEYPDHRGANGYDLVYLLAAAIKDGGASRQQIRDYLAGVGTKRPAFVGRATGKLAFDANGDATGREVTVGVVRGRRLVTSR